MLRPGRFDKLIFVQPPDEPHRAIMFENYLKEVPVSENIDYKKIAKETEATQVQIANICREAKDKGA